MTTSGICSNKLPAFHSPNPQLDITLPKTLVYHLASNPSNANIWMKLLKTCKLFFSRNYVIPVPYMKRVEVLLSVPHTERAKGTKWEISNTDYSHPDDFSPFRHQTFTIDLSVETMPKLYLYHCISSMSNIASIFSKIYVWDVKYVYLENQYLTWEQFQFLTSPAYFVAFNFNGSVKFSDGSLVPLETLIESFNEVKDFSFSIREILILPTTWNTIIKTLPRFKKLRCIGFSSVTPDNFDFFAFADYFKDNCNIGFIFHYCLLTNIPNEYKQRLDAYIDEQIANPPKRERIMFYPGDNRRQKMHRLIGMCDRRWKLPQD